MKVRLDRAALAGAVTWVGLAVPKAHSIPASAGIRLTASSGVLTLQAFDFDVSHTVDLPCDVLVEGQALVSAALTRQIIASLKGPSVELEVDGGRLVITAGRSTYRVGLMRLEDYPSLPVAPKAVGVIDAGDLAEIVGIAEHAAGDDAKVAALLAVHLAGDGENVSASATDRFRISYAQVPGDAEFEANIPAAVLGPALKPLRGEVTIGVEGGLVGLTDGVRSVTMRALDVEFPKLAAFVGMALPSIYEVDASELAAAVKRAALVAEAFAPVWLQFGTDEIAITSDSESGEAAEYVPCEGNAAIERQMSMNAQFFAEALTVLGGRVEIGVGELTKPITIRPVGSDRATLIVMPRRSTK